MLGEVVGSYRIIAEIAKGGMGVVYRAAHTLIDKPAAVKVLRREFSENKRLVERFFQEAKVTSSIRHPGIVEVFDFGHLANERAYLIMELLDGETLKQRYRQRGVLSPEAVTALAHSVASAVGAAHEYGVVHRDLKPDNIYLVPDPDVPGGERIKVLDFGLAKLTVSKSTSSQTRTGSLLGTPAYMAPEQCRGAGSVDHRADLYALGCIMYELLCGRQPFVGEGPGEIIGAHLYLPVPPPSRFHPGLPADLERVILKLLAKSPDERFQSMRELRRALGGTAVESMLVTVGPEEQPAADERADEPGSLTMSRTQNVLAGKGSAGSELSLSGGTLDLEPPTTGGARQAAAQAPRQGRAASEDLGIGATLDLEPEETTARRAPRVAAAHAAALPGDDRTSLLPAATHEPVPANAAGEAHPQPSSVAVERFGRGSWGRWLIPGLVGAGLAAGLAMVPQLLSSDARDKGTRTPASAIAEVLERSPVPGGMATDAQPGHRLAEPGLAQANARTDAELGSEASPGSEASLGSGVTLDGADQAAAVGARAPAPAGRSAGATVPSLTQPAGIARLELRIQPSQAIVKVDGKRARRGTLALERREQPYRITIEAPNHRSVEFSFVPTQDTIKQIVLPVQGKAGPRIKPDAKPVHELPLVPADDI